MSRYVECEFALRVTLKRWKPSCSKIATGLGVSVIVLLWRMAPTWAHPHVWVTVEMTVLYDKGNLTGLQHKWTFDEGYAVTALEDYKKNSDGTYDSKQLAELAKVNIDGLKEFGSFTYAVLGDQAVKLGEPQNYRLEYMNGALSLIFTLPFALPIAPAPSKNLTILVLDPTYFIAFELAKDSPVRFAQDALSKSCKATIAELVEGSAEAQRLSKVFAELGPELGYTQVSLISCGTHKG
jgi:ABC-type uncharacterized transport system substrate-binding protein